MNSYTKRKYDNVYRLQQDKFKKESHHKRKVSVPENKYFRHKDDMNIKINLNGNKSRTHIKVRDVFKERSYFKRKFLNKIHKSKKNFEAKFIDEKIKSMDKIPI